MRSLSLEDSSWDEPDRPARSLTLVHTPAPPPAEASIPSSTAGCFSDRRNRINWPAAGVAIGFNLALLAALVTMDVVPVPFAKPKPTVVTLMDLPKDPPPMAPPEQKVAPVQKIQPPIVAPPPIVQAAPQQPVPVLTAPEPPPVRAAVVAPPAAKPAPTGPVSVPDLSSKMVSARPPKYPIESRRGHEQGTVVLSVLLSTSGDVSDVSIARSSGFSRLDKAALEAVRRWRWSPTVQNGQPVMVRGIVEIPFVLAA